MSFASMKKSSFQDLLAKADNLNKTEKSGPDLASDLLRLSALASRSWKEDFLSEAKDIRILRIDVYLCISLKKGWEVGLLYTNKRTGITTV